MCLWLDVRTGPPVHDWRLTKHTPDENNHGSPRIEIKGEWVNNFWLFNIEQLTAMPRFSLCRVVVVTVWEYAYSAHSRPKLVWRISIRLFRNPYGVRITVRTYVRDGIRVVVLQLAWVAPTRSIVTGYLTDTAVSTECALEYPVGQQNTSGSGNVFFDPHCYCCW